jgi:hypothetical protein
MAPIIHIDQYQEKALDFDPKSFLRSSQDTGFNGLSLA